MRSLLRRPIDDLSRGMEHLADGPRAYAALALGFASLIVTWFVYVPVHELLHVAGCLVTGGSVTALELRPEYGGTLLARVFDFVVVGGEYSGRLSGFDTHGSDLVYLATDVAPYLLSVFIGIPLLRMSARSRHPVLFGAGITIGLAPLYNVIGDYYEMASILTTRGLGFLSGRFTTPVFEDLRSDDILLLIETLVRTPVVLGVESTADLAAAWAIVGISAVGAILLALLTYAAGSRFADAILGRES